MKLQLLELKLGANQKSNAIFEIGDDFLSQADFVNSKGEILFYGAYIEDGLNIWKDIHSQLSKNMNVFNSLVDVFSGGYFKVDEPPSSFV